MLLREGFWVPLKQELIIADRLVQNTKKNQIKSEQKVNNSRETAIRNKIESPIEEEIKE